MAHVEASYAAALLALAETPAEAARAGEALATLAEAVAGNRQLHSFLLDPVLPRAARRDVLVRLAPRGTPKNTLNCLRLLVDKGRIGLLPGVAEEYKRQLAAQSGTLIVRVCSAVPLDKQAVEKLRAWFAAQHGAADVLVEAEVDPALIGGVRVRVGDRLYDQSLFGRLEGLRRALGEQLHRNR